MALIAGFDPLCPGEDIKQPRNDSLGTTATLRILARELSHDRSKLSRRKLALTGLDVSWLVFGTHVDESGYGLKCISGLSFVQLLDDS